MTLPIGLLIMGNGDIYDARGKLLWESENGRGYRTVSVRLAPGRSKTFAVHRLVCEEFHGPPPSPQHEARHLDGNSRNNSASNLAWGTKAENEVDKLRHGTGAAKLTEAQVLKIRERRTSGERATALAQEYGVTASAIRRITTRKTWTHI